MAHYMLENLSVKEDISTTQADYLFSVEVVNDLVLHGTRSGKLTSWAGHRERNFQGTSPYIIHTKAASKPLYPADRRADGRSTRGSISERVEAAEAALVNPNASYQGTVYPTPDRENGRTGNQIYRKPIKPSVIPP